MKEDWKGTLQRLGCIAAFPCMQDRSWVDSLGCCLPGYVLVQGCPAEPHAKPSQCASFELKSEPTHAWTTSR